MNRCLLLTRRTALTLGVLALTLASTFDDAQAQSRRMFNHRTERGTIEFVNPPYVRVNGKDARLAPGSRLFNEDNRIVIASYVTGSKFEVRYLIDTMGQVGDVWILTQQEIAASSAGDKLKASAGAGAVAPKYNGPVFQPGKPLSEQHQFKNQY
jgi:hypothetical protein